MQTDRQNHLRNVEATIGKLTEITEQRGMEAKIGRKLTEHLWNDGAKIDARLAETFAQRGIRT